MGDVEVILAKQYETRGERGMTATTNDLTAREAAARAVAAIYPSSGITQMTANAAIDAYLAALSAADAVAQDGAVFPAKFLISGEAISNLVFQCGANDDNTKFSDAVAWVGDLMDDAGSTVHGLHAYSTEYPEYGSVTLVEFPARAALSAAAVAQEGAAEIKTLEWSDWDADLDTTRAKTATGEYIVTLILDEEGEAWHLSRWPAMGTCLDHYFSLESEAKAAAQADYEKRIRSALLHPSASALAAAREQGRREGVEQTVELAKRWRGWTHDYDQRRFIDDLNALLPPAPDAEKTEDEEPKP